MFGPLLGRISVKRLLTHETATVQRIGVIVISFQRNNTKDQELGGAKFDPAFYATPKSFMDERDRIFAKTWQLLGPVSRLSERGDYIAAEIAGLKVFVVTGRDGALRVFALCRHRGARLLPEGSGRCGPIRCPYHSWAYDDEGRLVAAPWFGEGSVFRKEDWPLKPIRVREWRGLVFAAVAPDTELEQQLGDLIPELADEPIETYQSVREERLTFDANWKIYTDNFVEGYHIPGIHPSFFAAIDFKQFSTTAHDGFVRMTAPPREGLFYRGKWLWMWPNWTLSLVVCRRHEHLAHQPTRPPAHRADL